MGYLVDDKRLLNDNTSEFAKKIESQYSIFLDKTPTFTDYFHINEVESTKETGLLNVEKLTGKYAATKYNMIKDFPIYGIEQIVLELEDDDDKGLDTSYESEGIILPNTVIPSVDDYFMITSVGKKFFFRVNQISYDTIKSNNFYKISFSIKAADEETYYDSFVSQSKEIYRTIFRNYGTEDKFILKEEDFFTVERLESLYREISDKYLQRFYSEKYNALIVHDPNSRYTLYDANVNKFCNNEAIFAQKDRDLYNKKFYIETRSDFDYNYSNDTIQGAISERDVGMIREKTFRKYYDLIPTFTDSIFQFYADFNMRGVQMIDSNVNVFGVPTYSVISDTFINNVLNNVKESDNIIYDVIANYLNNDDAYVGKLLYNYKTRFRVNNDYESYVMIPLFLYAVHSYYDYLVRKC